MFKFLVLFAVIGQLGADSVDKFLFPKLPNYVENSKNKTCNFHSQLYVQHLSNYSFWAHEMLDSSAKHNTGLLRGNTHELGNFHQCISTEAPFTTQFCVAQVTAHVPTQNPGRDPFSIHFDPYESVFNRVRKTEDQSQISRHSVQFGLCLPASCSAQDLQDNLNKFVANATVQNVTYEVEVSHNLCQRQGYEKNFDSWDVTFCFFVFVILSLVISATILDYVEENSKVTSLKSLLQTFSVRQNFRELIQCKNTSSPLAIINAMKTFSIFMIITMHRFALLIPSPLLNFDYIEKEYRIKYAAFLFHGDLFVDSFFMFSGILVAYLLLIQKTSNPFFIVAMRYLRLTPAYAFVILYYSSVFFYTGSGPFWNLIVGGEMKDCRKILWTKLLYIDNYVNSEHMCMGQTWYLPCDFHFFIMSVIVILTIKKNKKVGFSLLGALLVASIIIPFVVTTVNSEAPMLFFYISFLKDPKSYPYFRNMYIKSHIRATPYIIGLITGYIYYKFRKHPISLSKFTSYVLAYISVVTIGVCLLLGSIFYNSYHPYNAVEAGAYAGLHTLPWTIGTACFMISISYGKGGLLKTVLSWSLWSPLAKLTYSAYLLHMQFPLRNYAGAVSSTSLGYFNGIHLAIADITIAFLLALLLYLGVEAPIQIMFKMFMQPKKNAENFRNLSPPQNIPEGTNTHV